MKYTGFIDITIKIESNSLADFVYYMNDTQERLEDDAAMHGEILELNVREGDEEETNDTN